MQDYREMHPPADCRLCNPTLTEGGQSFTAYALVLVDSKATSVVVTIITRVATNSDYC
jgi:hypothetical protein